MQMIQHCVFLHLIPGNKLNSTEDTSKLVEPGVVRSVLLYHGDKRVLMWLWACGGDKQRHFCISTDLQLLLPLDGTNYAVYKGCVLHDWWKLEPNAIKRDVLAYRRCPAASLTVQTKHCLRYQAGPRCILGYAGPWRIHLEQPLNSGNKGCVRLTFEGVFKIGTASLCRMWLNEGCSLWIGIQKLQ